MQGLSGKVRPRIRHPFSAILSDMSTENLSQEISQLRQDLKNLEELDDATRAELTLLEKRIEDLLDENNEEETVPEKVISHIEESATNFAVQHPKAEGLLRRIAYALGRTM